MPSGSSLQKSSSTLHSIKKEDPGEYVTLSKESLDESAPPLPPKDYTTASRGSSSSSGLIQKPPTISPKDCECPETNKPPRQEKLTAVKANDVTEVMRKKNLQQCRHLCAPIMGAKMTEHKHALSTKRNPQTTSETQPSKLLALSPEDCECPETNKSPRPEKLTDVKTRNALEVLLEGIETIKPPE